MGVESDTRAWSAYGGRWRPVRITYPRLWPIAWGAEPLAALAIGVGAVLAGAVALWGFGALTLFFLDGITKKTPATAPPTPAQEPA